MHDKVIQTPPQTLTLNIIGSIRGHGRGERSAFNWEASTLTTRAWRQSENSLTWYGFKFSQPPDLSVLCIMPFKLQYQLLKTNVNHISIKLILMPLSLDQITATALNGNYETERNVLILSWTQSDS